MRVAGGKCGPANGSAQTLHSVKGDLIGHATLLGGGAAAVLAGALTFGRSMLLRCARYVLLETRALGDRVLYFLPLYISFSLVLSVVVMQGGRVAPLGCSPLVGGARARVGRAAGGGSGGAEGTVD